MNDDMHKESNDRKKDETMKDIHDWTELAAFISFLIWDMSDLHWLLYVILALFCLYGYTTFSIVRSHWRETKSLKSALKKHAWNCFWAVFGITGICYIIIQEITDNIA